uniref:Uncharacterized protein n=1 Tax=Rhizophora mucronata TaxID=61149 RepID=A0A2P2QTT9_RHIMU
MLAANQPHIHTNMIKKNINMTTSSTSKVSNMVVCSYNLASLGGKIKNKFKS